MSQNSRIKPWYKHVWPWVLMAGPIFVVIASVAMFFVAQQHATDLVTDDYYKDGKNIDIQLHRDEEAVRRHIRVQVLISPDMNAAKVFVSGEFDGNQPLKLLLMHPTRKADDQTVNLKPVGGVQNDRAEYEAVFKTLPPTNHWYLRVEDAAGMWRVENKWITSQGNAVDLTPMDKLFNNTESK
ncbi:FixH family protein [Neisseria cinerea]|uniref:FixH family protein n=2 Tax=Neisseria cinerea TaxID=483 RepID=A0A7T3BKY5_NEICI|nr:FixH family protein [Neisseria cinerea]MCD2071374.1 FixH family protein [Neisseria cinerea]QPT37517.1 FixH family protein [Neisseria cinerea]RKV84969.1 MAG: hypothetical protein D8H97_04520 [Neisseria sp.]SQF83047.1 Inner membrane protein [Neisseria cinerea]